MLFGTSGALSWPPEAWVCSLCARLAPFRSCHHQQFCKSFSREGWISQGCSGSTLRFACQIGKIKVALRDQWCPQKSSYIPLFPPQISSTSPLTSVPVWSPLCRGGGFRSPWAPLILLTTVCHMEADHELLKVCGTLIDSWTIQQCFLQLQSSCQNLINDHVSHIFFLLQKEYFFLLLI